MFAWVRKSVEQANGCITSVVSSEKRDAKAVNVLSRFVTWHPNGLSFEVGSWYSKTKVCDLGSSDAKRLAELSSKD